MVQRFVFITFSFSLVVLLAFYVSRNQNPMASEKKIAVVTGGNKGIGLAICRRLAKENPDLTVILTARDDQRGKDAVEILKGEGISNVHYHQLDILDKESAQALALYLEKEYGGLDILVNNAGMAYKGSAFNETVASETIATNYFGTARTYEILAPHLRPGARVVFVSSQAGKLGKLSKKLQTEFLRDNLSIEELDGLMKSFIMAVGDGTYDERGWPRHTYGVSKCGISMYTRLVARDEGLGRDILINACCPGWVRTDMAGPNAPLSPDEGSITPVWLATLPPGDERSGGFFYRKKPISWV